jgi:hypothetical protein
MGVASLLLLTFLTTILAAAPVRAADAQPWAEFSLSKRTATVGDTLTYLVQVSVPGGGHAVFSPPGAAIGDFEVLGRRRRPDFCLESGGAMLSEEILLATYSTGSRAVPPLPVTVVSADGDSTVLGGDTLFVAVNSVLGEGEQKLRDIKGPATISGSSHWPKVALAAAAAAVILVLLYLRRRRGRQWALSPAKPGSPPHVLALERLEALLESRLLETGRFKDFYTELSDLLREYLGGRFLIQASEMTTRELAVRLEYLGLPDGFRLETSVILEESDMVKFAKFKPDIEAAVTAAGNARNLVRENIAAGAGRVMDGIPEVGARTNQNPGEPEAGGGDS